MRSHRYQLVALLMAAVVFVVGMTFRLLTATSPAPADATQASVQAAPTAEVVLVQATSTTAPAAAAAAAQDPDRYREALVGRLTRLNPLYAGASPVDRDVSSLIFEGLTTTNSYGEPVPALADRWVISSDGLEYIVFLRDDVLWQDGVPFTADDVVYTMDILASPDFSGPEALAEFWRTVETQALDAHTVRFRLAQPLGTFLDRLQIGILPEHVLRGTGAAELPSHPFNLSPVGTGPYQLSALETDGSRVTAAILAAAPTYTAREPQAASRPPEVEFKLYEDMDRAVSALEDGQVDGLASSTAADRDPLFMAANNDNLTMQNQIENSLGVLLFNWQSDTASFFRDPRVRVALAAGLDRDSALARTMGSAAVSADSPLMPGSWAYQADLPWPAYDPSRARDLVAQAAERAQRLDGESTPSAPVDSGQIAPGAEPTVTPLPTPLPDARFAFSILTPDRPALVSLAQEIAAQWSQLGLDVTVDAAADEVYAQRLDDGTFDAAIAELALGDSADPDVYAFWNQGQYPDGENYSGVDDQRISVMLERARRDAWGVNRSADYRDFQREFAERVIALPLYYPLYTYVTSPRVNGVQLGFIGSPSDRFRNIDEWRLNAGA